MSVLTRNLLLCGAMALGACGAEEDSTGINSGGLRVCKDVAGCPTLPEPTFNVLVTITNVKAIGDTTIKDCDVDDDLSALLTGGAYNWFNRYQPATDGQIAKGGVHVTGSGFTAQTRLQTYSSNGLNAGGPFGRYENVTPTGFDAYLNPEDLAAFPPFPVACRASTDAHSGRCTGTDDGTNNLGCRAMHCAHYRYVVTNGGGNPATQTAAWSTLPVGCNGFGCDLATLQCYELEL